MPSTAQTLVDEIVDAHGIVEATALRYLDRRHKKMVARSKINKRTVAVGDTVAAQSFYEFDAIELLSFEVGGAPYAKARRPDLYGYSQGTLVWVGPSGSGLIVSDADDDGVRGLSLIPTPSESGTAITAYAAMPADTLELDSVLLTDDDFDDALVEGVSATVLAREDESEAAADRYEARFDVACEELRVRVRRRFRGPGPAQIRVAGLNA